MGLSTISRAKRDQTWREDVVTNGIGRVEGITVDWIAGLDQAAFKSYFNLFHHLRLLHNCTSIDKGRCSWFISLYFYRKYLLDWPGLWRDWGGQAEWLFPLCSHFPRLGQTQSHHCPPRERVRLPANSLPLPSVIVFNVLVMKFVLFFQIYFHWNALLNHLACVSLCAGICSGLSGVSTLVLSALGWMAPRGWSWSMRASVGQMESQSTTRCGLQLTSYCLNLLKHIFLFWCLVWTNALWFFQTVDLGLLCNENYP